jgi:hypothetical protein
MRARWLAFALSLGVLSLGALAPAHEALAAPPAVAVADVGAQTDEAFRELDQASAAAGPARGEHARRARELFLACHATSPSWRTAGGLSLAESMLGRPAVASGWYWLASDLSDYSDGYLAWQKIALASVFDGRVAVTLDLSRPAKTVHLDDAEIPPGAFDRPLAVAPGDHDLRVTASDGGTFHGAFRARAEDVGKRTFFKVEIHPAGWLDPSESGPVTAPRPQKEGGLSALQIVTIVGTVALASGIAVGGGYLLFGRDNPHGLDSAEGVAIVSTELVLIGAGTAIALISD